MMMFSGVYSPSLARNGDELDFSWPRFLLRPSGGGGALPPRTNNQDDMRVCPTRKADAIF